MFEELDKMTYFVRAFAFKDIRFNVKVKEFHKVARKIKVIISASACKDENKFSIYISKYTVKVKSHCVPICDFNRFINNQTLHRYRKYFCCYCFHPFSSAAILEIHNNDCFQINGKQII